MSKGKFGWILALEKQERAIEVFEAALAPSEPVTATERRCARDGRCRWTDGRDARSCNLARSEILCSEFVDANAPESPDGSNDREILGSSPMAAPSNDAKKPEDPAADCGITEYPVPTEPGYYWIERGVDKQIVRVLPAFGKLEFFFQGYDYPVWVDTTPPHKWLSGKLPPPGKVIWNFTRSNGSPKHTITCPGCYCGFARKDVEYWRFCPNCAREITKNFNPTEKEKNMSKYDTKDKDRTICPHCGYEYGENTVEYVDGEHQCWECGGKFYVVTKCLKSYTTQKVNI